MEAARGPRRAERLLVVDPCAAEISDAGIGDLPALLRPGDLLVLNDAATLPASFHGRFRDEPVELRLLSREGDDVWTAVLFGAGDWRLRTEDRLAPPLVAPGEVLALGDELAAEVRAVSALSPRLLEVRLSSSPGDLWETLYRLGRPVQYSYLGGDVDLASFQTAYAARPWAVEMPSAGRPLRWETLLAARRRGVRLATITHAAGLSATGDPALDAALPFTERYEIPESTVLEVAAASVRGGRVVAVGTTVVRALEGSARASGALRAGRGETDIHLDAGFTPTVVDGILTGMHEPGSSHHELLTAFATAGILEKANAHAEASGYLAHEFGDSALVLCGTLP